MLHKSGHFRGRRHDYDIVKRCHPTMPPGVEVDMDSGMIGKIQKARLYAEEPERMQFETFRILFRGEHDTHKVGYDRGTWDCTCRFFQTHRVCSHTMALERVLGQMLKVVDDVPDRSL